MALFWGAPASAGLYYTQMREGAPPPLYGASVLSCQADGVAPHASNGIAQHGGVNMPRHAPLCLLNCIWTFLMH